MLAALRIVSTARAGGPTRRLGILDDAQTSDIRSRTAKTERRHSTQDPPNAGSLGASPPGPQPTETADDRHPEIEQG
jgi:hypothetical protein